MDYLIAGYTSINSPICFMFDDENSKQLYRDSVYQIVYDGEIDLNNLPVFDDMLLNNTINTRARKYKITKKSQAVNNKYGGSYAYD